MKSHTFVRTIKLLSILMCSNLVVAQESDSYLHLISIDSSSKDLSDFSASYQGDNSDISILNFTGNFDRDIDGLLNLEARQVVTQELFNHQPDQYDFLVIFTKFPVDSGDAAAFNISFENDVQGIGLPIFDNSMDMGSERLQATIDMTELSDWEMNPSSNQFKLTLDALIHEMMHRWGIQVKYVNEIGQISDLTLGRDGFHWNYFLNSNASLMYGSLWEDLGANQFRTTSTSKALSPLDLYLMGFREPTSVPNFFLINDGSPGDRFDIPPFIGTEVTGSRVDISIDDIIAAEGERVPAATDAQHKFNFKFVLLKSPSQEVTSNDIGGLVVLQREFQKRFFAETSGLGEVVYPKAGIVAEADNPDVLVFDETNNQQVNLDTAKLFIVNNFIDTEKHWRDKPATKFRDTAMAIMALRNQEQELLIGEASQWLGSNRTGSITNDQLAWLLISESLTLPEKAATVITLLDQMNVDGGWGLTEGAESSAYDTALVILGLRTALRADYSPAQATLSYVEAQLNADGGSGYVAGGKSALSSSALLLLSFYELTQNTNSEQLLVDYIINLQNPDGGFGVEESTAHETALVIKALNVAVNQDHAQATEIAKDKLSGMQSQDGSFEGSIYSTALALQVLFDDQKPNLSIDFAQLSNNQAVAGEQTSIEYTISNTGETPAENVILQVLSGQQVIASELIPLISPAQSSSSRLAFDTSTMLGEINLTLFVDPENNIIEVNESDNQAILTLNVEQQSLIPELAIDYTSINFSSDYFDVLPFEFNASFKVNNLSLIDLVDVKVSLMRVIDEFNQEELQSVIANIDANQSQLFDFSTQISTAEDDLELVFVIDPQNQVNEVNEFNNELITILKQLSTIDLSIAAPQISLPNQFTLGQSVGLSFEFSNLGTQLSPGFNATVIYDGSSGEQVLYESQIVEMLGGQKLTRQFSWVPFEPGEHSLSFVIDQGNSVSEVNETNNSITIPISVVGNTSTNLEITDTDITINPDPGLTGQTLEITALIKNNSNTDSGPYDVSFYHQQFDQPSELISTLSNNSSVAPGDENTVTIQINEYNRTGEVSFIAEIDADNHLTEFNEDDNIGLKTFRIFNKPDGMVSAGGISLVPTIPVNGALLNVDVTVSNIGEQDLVGANIKLYTKSTTGLSEVDSENVPLIEAGQNQVVSFDFMFPVDSEVSKLLVKFDETDQIDEINENNNQAELTIENQSRAFYVTESFFSPNGDGIKDRTQVVFNLDAVDDYEIKILNQFNDVVRHFPVFLNRTFGDVYWDGRDSQQKIAGDGEYIVMLTGSSTGEQMITTVWLDTNRTTLNESLVQNDAYITELNCAIDIIGGLDAERAAQYSLDGRYIYLKSYFGINTSEQKGLFALAIDGSSIESIIPSSFTQENLVEYFEVLDSGHILLGTSIYLSGNKELWYLNTDNKIFHQLDTQQNNSFFVDFIQTNYVMLRISGNQSDRLKVYFESNRSTETVSNIYPSGSSLIKMSGGWIENNFSNQSIWFRHADLQQTDVLLGEEILAISSDNSKSLIKKANEIILYAFNGAGVSEVNVYETSDVGEPVSYNSLIEFAPDNQFIWFNDGFITLYAPNGELKFNIEHPFNLDFIQAGLIDAFGSLDTIRIRNEIGNFLVSYDQLQNTEISFQNVFINWLSATEFTLRFSVTFLADINASDAGGLQTPFQYSGNWFFSQRIQLKDFPNWSTFDTVLIADKVPELNSPYFMSGTNLARKKLDFDQVDAESDLFGDFDLLKTYPTQPHPNYVKSLLLKNRNPNYVTSCKDVGDTGIYGIYLPKANLTAFMDLTLTAFGIEISGTFFDAHLEKYEVYYADSMNPETWNLIGVGTGEKDKELLFNWLPPVSGAYKIKLVVTDKSGNVTSVVKSTQVSRNASTITVPVVEPIYFSPNGDGVIDTTTIQYDSLQAGEVLVEITDVNGQVVKSWFREYAQAGAAEELVWDGKDNNNTLLEDGEYFIKVDGFKYIVLIDSQSDVPTGNIEFQIVPSGDYEILPKAGHTRYSYRGNLWKLEFKGGGGSNLNLGNGVVTASPIRTSVVQKFTGSEWSDLDSSFFVMRPDNYFEQRELYRSYVTDMAGNDGVSGEIKYDEKIFASELLKLQNASPEALPLVFPMWELDWRTGKHLRTASEGASSPFSDWNINEKLGFSFQTLTNESIDSIKMTTTYTNAENQVISEDRFIETESYAVIEEYYPGYLIPPVNYPAGSFIVMNDNNEVVLHLLEFDQTDFPDVPYQINVKFDVTFIDNPISENISFDIQFNESIGMPIFTTVPIENNAYELLSDDEKTAYLDVIENIDLSSDKTYLWFYLLDQQLNAQSWVDLSEFSSGQFVATTPTLYNSVSSDHISQVFELELECGVLYKAEWTSSEINFDPVLNQRLSKSCDFDSYQEFYLNGYCDQNATENDTLDFKLLGNLEADDSQDPVLLEVFWFNGDRTFELIYTDSLLSESVQLDDEGDRAILKTVNLPANDLVAGVNTFKAKFSYLNRDDVELVFELINTLDKADFEIIEPVDGAFICGQNNSNSSQSSVPLNLNMLVPSSQAKPYAVNLLRFVDGVNLDSQGPLSIVDNNYGFINEFKFEYESTNVLDPSEFVFKGAQIQQSIDLNFGKREGSASIQVETINPAGLSQCQSVEIQIDTLVKGFVEVNSENYNFSPNLTGVLNYATLNAEEPLQVVVEIYQRGVFIEEIESFQMITGGNQALSWDGVVGAGLLDDGVYDFVIKLTDSCGNLNVRTVAITLDKTVPGLSFISPESGASVSSSVEVIFTADEINLLSLELAYEYLGFLTPIEFISFPSPSTNGESYIAQWDLTELPLGPYHLHLSGVDEAGNENSISVQVNYVESQNLIWQFAISDRFISPNGDAVLDSTQIELGLNVNAVVDLTVVDLNDSLIKDLDNQSLSFGSHTFYWDGTNNLGQAVVDGSYQIKLQATEVGNPGNAVVMYLKLKSDVTVPLREVDPNRHVIKGAGDLTLSISDENLLSQTVFIQQLNPLDGEQALQATDEFGSLYTVDLAALNETSYQLNSFALDHAGNETSQSHEFIIDNTPPTIDLTSPAGMSFQGGTDSEVMFSGNIFDTNFDEYQLSISENINEPVWIELFQSNELLDNQFTQTWPITVADGAYLVKASAIDQAGWEVETVKEVVIDRQAPVVELSPSLDSTLQGQRITIIGTVLDANLSFYHLSYQLNDESDWMLIHSGIESIDADEIIDWAHGLQSGVYSIRLFAGDEVGLTSESIISIEIDSSPPESVNNLQAELLLQKDVNLSWQPSSSPDLLGYQIYRNNTLLNSELINNVDYQDTDLAEGEYNYWVIAVDALGNQSERSNVVNILVDRTGPQVSIQQPVNMSIVNGFIDVVGSAEEVNDFETLKLYLRPSNQPAPGEILAESYLPLQAALLAQIDTTLLVQGSEYIIRLEAQDLSSNINVVEHVFTVDNTAPAAPLNLTYQLLGSSDVKLDWQMNLETDLAGYLVYRDDLIISGNGTADSGIITGVTYLDETVSDGDHRYYITAIDLATNISEASNVVEVNINRRAPDTLITNPNDGLSFENPISIISISEDNDIASIAFEYSIDNQSWQPLSQVFNSPYTVTLNPEELGLVYGDVFIRATAQDVGGQTDLTPAQISLEYTDLTPPEPVQSLQTAVMGDAVQLSWAVSSEADLQGYLVSRKQLSPNLEVEFTELNVDLLISENFLDTGVTEGVYSYRVFAVDDYDNLSESSETSDLTVWSIELAQPFSPVLLPADVALSGYSLIQGGVNPTLEDVNGTQTLPTVQVQGNGSFNLSYSGLSEGENKFSLHVEDIVGNESIQVIRSIEGSPLPLVPMNPQSTVNGVDVALSWQAADANTVGYLPYIDDEPVLGRERLVTGITVDTSSSASTGQNVLDNLENTYWAPQSTDVRNGEPTYIELYFDQAVWVSNSEIIWYGSSFVYRPSAYQLQYLSPIGWITQEDFTGDESRVVTHSGEVPYLATGARIWMPLEANNFDNIRLSEFNIQYQPLISDLSYDTSLPDGSYVWQVTAINSYGFESGRTEVDLFAVGDIIPPDVVVLNGEVENGNNVGLNWSASSSGDVAYYRVFRNGDLIVSTEDANVLNYMDQNLANGTYDYHVVTVDLVGNSSDASNLVRVEISQQVLDPPTGLSITSLQTGGSLQLNWNSHLSPNWAEFRVYQSVSDETGFTEIGHSVDSTWLDENLSNGVTYFYYVTAIDTSGNESLPSLIKSGIPNDLIQPAKPVINGPTISGSPIVVNTLNTDVLGYGSPNVEVDLYQNNVWVDTVIPTSQYSQTELRLSQPIFDIRYNNSNSVLAFSDFNTGELSIAQPESGIFKSVRGSSLRYHSWNQSGSKLYVVSGSGTQTELNAYGIDGEEIGTLISGFRISAFIINEDESQMFYWGDGVNPDTTLTEEGLWIYTFSNNNYQKIDVGGSTQLVYYAIEWLSDGGVAFINYPNGPNSEGVLWVQQPQGGPLQMIEANLPGGSILSVNAGGTHLYYSVPINNNKGIKRYRVSDADIQIYSKDGIDITLPYVKQDIDLVIVNLDCCNKEIINMATGEVVERFNNTGSRREVNWLDDGRLMYLENFGPNISIFKFIIQPGIFEFNDVTLTSGQNEFYAVARKSNGTESQPSDSILLTLNDSLLADLEIKASYLQVLPSQVTVGRPVTGSVLIKNSSLVDVEEARLLIEVVDTDLNTVLVAPAPLDFSLAAGELLVENFTVNGLDTEGEYTIRVVADSNQQVQEFNENNNTTFKIIQVIDDLNVDLDVGLTTTEVSPGDDLMGQLRVYNPSDELNGSVTIRITDDEGYPVGYEQSYAITDLSTGSAWEQVFNWNSSDVFAGAYFVEVTLYDQNQQELEVQIESFNVNEIADFSLLLTTSAAQITNFQTLNLILDVNYQSGNVNQSGTLTWEIFDDTQQLIWSNTMSTGLMSPGFNGVFENNWVADQIGTFQANVTLNTPLRTQTTIIPFEVIPVEAPLSLSGLLDDIPSGILLGESWNVEYGLQNNGQVNLSDVPVSLSLWNSELSQLIDQQNTVISLAAGISTSSVTTWSSIDLSLDNYVLILTADLSALGASAQYLLDTQTIQTIDATGPQINVINPAEQGYYSSSLELRVVVNDLYSTVESIDINLDTNAVVSIPGRDFNDVYQYWLTELSEGEHQIDVLATDVYGNANNQTVNFNVDSTSPLIDITGVSDTGLYNNTRQANITINDINLSDSQITLDGLPYISGDEITSEGSHILMVSATDLAGNVSTRRLSFYIDLTAPLVVIAYPENNSETNQVDSIVSGSTEMNAQVVLANGAYTDVVNADFEGNFSFAEVPLFIGNNTIMVSATDLAGNLGQATEVNVKFVDDISVSGQLTAAVTHPLGQSLSIDWQILNLNAVAVNQLPVELNLYSVAGNQLVSTDAQVIDLNAAGAIDGNTVMSTSGLIPGDHRIELRVEIDQLWQILDDQLILLEDVLGPELIVIEPQTNQITAATLDLIVQATDLHSQVEDVSYQLNGDANWVSMTWNGIEYVDEIKLNHGQHQINFRAMDTFDNETITAVIPFTVDTNPPVIDVMTPVDGLITNQTVVIDFVVTDEHSFDVDAQLNQALIANGDSVTAEGIYDLEINASDEVNNQSNLTRSFIIDTTDPLLVVTSPTVDTQNTSGFIDISGEAEERNIITISVNGSEITVKTDALGQFIITDQTLELGMNVVVVTATDQAGNVSDAVTRNVEYVQVGSITGKVWQDEDQDTIIDDKEEGFNQISLRLTDSAQFSLDILTNTAGDYQFTGLSEGQYTVEVIEPDLLSDWVNTTTNIPTTVDVVGDQETEINFGFYQSKPVIEATAYANSIKGRLLVLVDPPTSQVDNNQCVGVSEYQMQKIIDMDFMPGDSVWASLYDDQGNLLQTETASFADFVNNNYQIIDEQGQTNSFNLTLHPVQNRQLNASVVSSSSASPAVISESYRLELGLQNSEGNSQWSSELISDTCDIFSNIGMQSGELQWTGVELNPSLASDDPNGSSQAPQLISQQVMLESLLDTAGWSYQVTTDTNDFASQLGSGQYVAYALLAENVLLSSSTQNNLMAVVDEGAGLLVASGHDNLSESFYSALGVDVIGSHFTATELSLLDSVITKDQVLEIAYDEQVLRASLTDAMSAGVFNGPGISHPENQALTWINTQSMDPGLDGSSVFSGMDWLIQATDTVGFNHYAELIKTVLNYIHPLGLSNELGYARAVQLNLQNLGRPVDGYIQVLLPPMLTLVHSEIPVDINQSGFTFEYDMLEGETEAFEFWLKVDTTPATITFEIYLDNNTSVFNSLDLTLVAGERPDLAANISNCEAGVGPGQTLLYKYDVVNTGNIPINAALAFTELGAGLVSPAWTCSGALGGNCGQSSGSGNLSGQSIDLPVGASVSFLFDTQVVIPNSSSVMASAHVLMPEGVFDVNPENNNGVDFDDVYPFVFKSSFECSAAGQMSDKSLSEQFAKEGQ